MYKVFIDNKPILFQINSQLEDFPKRKEYWKEISNYLESQKDVLVVEIKNKEHFEKIMKKHKYIEAAGGMVRRGDAYLFIKRNELWDIPKGKIEKGESPEVAAVREIEEECGLKAPVIKKHLIDTWHTYLYKGKKVLKKTYWYELDEGEEIVDLIPQEEEGITEVAYFEIGDFEKIKKNTYLSIIEVMDVLLTKKK